MTLLRASASHCAQFVATLDVTGVSRARRLQLECHRIQHQWMRGFALQITRTTRGVGMLSRLRILTRAALLFCALGALALAPAAGAAEKKAFKVAWSIYVG